MDIVIISEFSEDLSKMDNDRFAYLANILSEKNTVEIITSNFWHSKKRHGNSSKDIWPFSVTYLNEPGYSKNICLKRFYSHYIWGRNVGRYLKYRKIPDIVYCAVPSLTAANKVAAFCKKNGVRFIVDVQDLWPEAFQMVFNIPLVSDLIYLPFKILSERIYKAATDIVAVSKTYARRAIKKRSSKKATVVFLGTKLDDFDRNTKRKPILHKAKGELWMGYCGTLGASYDIDVVIEALKNMKSYGVIPPKFIVMGDGDKRELYEQLAREKKVDALFTGRISYMEVCSVLAECDMVVNPIHAGSAGSIINKHADYAASGLPVLNTQESTEYRHLVEQYNMGFNCDCVEDLTEKIIKLSADDKLRKEMGANARRCAEEKFDRGNTYLKLIRLIEEG